MVEATQRRSGRIPGTAVWLTFLLIPAGSALAQSGPGNDRFSDAVVLSGPSASASGTNVGAGEEPGEPEHGNFDRFWGFEVNSVWWKWTAPASGTTLIHFSANFEHSAAIYTGSTVSSLSYIVNTNTSGQSPSQLFFTAVAGTVYRIAVDGVGNFTGSVSLSISMGPTPPSTAYKSWDILVAPEMAGGTIHVTVHASGPYDVLLSDPDGVVRRSEHVSPWWGVYFTYTAQPGVWTLEVGRTFETEVFTRVETSVTPRQVLEIDGSDGGGCGLLGLEVLGVLALIRRPRRRRGQETCSGADVAIIPTGPGAFRCPRPRAGTAC